MLIVIVYTFYNSSKITTRFINVTVTIVQCSYIDGITLLITSEEHYDYKRNVFCNFVGKRFAYTIFIYQDICSWVI